MLEQSLSILSLKKLRNDDARVEGDCVLGSTLGESRPRREFMVFHSFLG